MENGEQTLKVQPGTGAATGAALDAGTNNEIGGKTGADKTLNHSQNSGASHPLVGVNSENQVENNQVGQGDRQNQLGEAATHSPSRAEEGARGTDIQIDNQES